MSLAAGAYRACLRAYPAGYRAERGEEILATLAEAHDGRRLPVAGELGSLVRAGLAERNRADLAETRGRWLWRGLAMLALPLACANAAVALAGLAVAWSFPHGPGRWWPAFALVAVALAVAVAARRPRAAALLGFAVLAFVAADAASMTNSEVTPHLRLLEHYGDTRPIPFPDQSASVPSNPSEIVPFAAVLALACLALARVPGRRPSLRAGLVRVTLVLAAAAALAGVALADPDGRFAFLLVPALAVALGGLAAGLAWARAAVAAAALLVASAPSVLWYLSASAKVDPAGTTATRDIVRGLVAAAALLLAALVAAALARRAARRVA